MSLSIVSDYQVLRDGSVTLGEGTAFQEQYQWFVHDDFLFTNTNRQDWAVLTFNIRVRKDAELTVEAVGSGPTTILNGTSFSKGFTRTYQEAFNLTQIVIDTNKTIGTPIGSMLFNFSVEKGIAVISDVVLHYKIGIYS